MKLSRVAMLAAVLFVNMAITTSAVSLGETREEKMELYKILYGEEAPMGEIQPALASGTVSDSETDSADNEELSKLFQNEEKLYLPEALKRLDEIGESVDNIDHLRELLESMIMCQGVYIQTGGKSASNKVYTAEIEIFLKYGVPTCIIDYTNYMGYLEEAEVSRSKNEEYTFETHPIGKNAGRGQEFFIEFDDENMHVIWAEGSIEQYLKKSSGDAGELEDEQIPLTETDTYKNLVKQIDESLNDLDHQVVYDEENKTLNIYVVIIKNGRQMVLENGSAMQESWKSLLEGWKTATEKVHTALTLQIRDGLFDTTQAHCAITVVDDLKDEGDYYPQEIWAVIKDGAIEYNFLEESVSDSSDDSSAGSNDTGSWKNDESKTQDYTYSSSSGEKNALRRAKEYLEYTHFSYSGLVDQLEFEGYSHSEAVYGVDHCGADWFEQAAGKAKDYLDYTAFSYDGLVEQLEFEGFTHEQAVYGANKSY